MNKDSIKKITSMRLFLPIVCLVAVLLVNLITTPGFFSFGIRREPDIGCEAAGLDLISMIAPTSHAPLDSVFQHRRRLKKWQLYRMVLLWAVPLFVCVRSTDGRQQGRSESMYAA